MSILSLNHITKSYDRFKALEDITFSVPAQSIFGMLGPNGSGKTTTIRIITNILAADSGEVLFDNNALSRNHIGSMGYMPEERGMYKKMKVYEQLVYLAKLKGLKGADARKKVSYWLQRLDIKAWWNKRIDELSKGMQQKIQFIATVVHEPKLIILDEPFSGLDPVNSELIKNEIAELRKNGATVIFSTHRMEQVEEICEEIILVNKGRIILEGKVKEIKHRFKKNLFSIKYTGIMPTLNESDFSPVQKNGEEILIKLNNGKTPNDLLKTLLQQNTAITGFNEVLPSLNEIFIQQVTTHE